MKISMLSALSVWVFCFWGGGKCHLSALLSWWKSLWGVTRGGYLGSRSITSRLAAGARDLQTLKVGWQISVGWPGGGASATVSPLLRWSPWRGSSFMEQTVFIPCFCAIDVDLFDYDYRWCKGTGLYDDAPDWRDARRLSLSPGSSSSLKKATLPTKPCRVTSSLVGKAFQAAGQAGAALHTMAVLQAYQADLLKDLSTGGSIDEGAFLELRPFYGCHGFHGETSVAQPHGHQGQRPHFPPWCPHLTFRPIWRRR